MYAQCLAVSNKTNTPAVLFMINFNDNFIAWDIIVHAQWTYGFPSKKGTLEEC